MYHIHLLFYNHKSSVSLSSSAFGLYQSTKATKLFQIHFSACLFLIFNFKNYKYIQKRIEQHNEPPYIHYSPTIIIKSQSLFHLYTYLLPPTQCGLLRSNSQILYNLIYDILHRSFKRKFFKNHNQYHTTRLKMNNFLIPLNQYSVSIFKFLTTSVLLKWTT